MFTKNSPPMAPARASTDFEGRMEGDLPTPSTPSRSNAGFLKTSYKTRGKKERQESLFQDLVAEIEAETKKKNNKLSNMMD